MAHRMTFHDLPRIDPEWLQPIDIDALVGSNTSRDAPRILVLYGSLRSRSYSRFLAEESARLLRWFGCEVQLFDPSGLPLPEDADADHPRVQMLRELATWSEGMVWISPERYGAMTGIMKAQIDWMPLSLGACARPRARPWP